ncbi:hypothetical protein [Silvibacterium acidisoli]|uniref:hypothetical protein n=1 Tax=Acidobacteriaceae bacterium ZG23-2 TaxID=2883246 RepID=UPI00406C179E
MRSGSRIFGVLLAAVSFTLPSLPAQQGSPAANHPVRTERSLAVGSAQLQVKLAEGHLDAGDSAIFEWVQRAAKAVSLYYGSFPLKQAQILVVPGEGRSGVSHGTTWGDMQGAPGFTRISVGEHTTSQELAADWMMTHELTHMAFPSLTRDHHWMEEGMATYIEPVARMQAGQLSREEFWKETIAGMPNGEPASGDEGLDRTHTWGRTYWGGALFYLVADISIRQQTGNRKGVEDAFRGIVAAGGTIDHDWPVEKVLEAGDRATGTPVLTRLYRKWSQSPETVDLDALWKDLGVQSIQGEIHFNESAKLAAVRRMMEQPSR